MPVKIVIAGASAKQSILTRRQRAGLLSLRSE